MSCVNYVKSRRVVVTGLGMVASLGNTCKENWEGLVQKKSGVRSLENEDFGKELPNNCRIGAPISKNFEGKKYRTLGTDNLLTQMTMSAAEEAVRDSKINFTDRRSKFRTGVYLGSSLPSLSCISESLKKVYQNDYTHINRMLMLRMLTNLLASNVSIKYDLRGPIISPTMACATSLNSIGESYRLIKNNTADVMVCGGSENSIHPLVFHAMNKLNTLYSSSRNYPAEKASRPFDLDRAGFIIGEGSGVLILEDLEHALKRNAEIYCEIVGYATYGDAFHLTKPTVSGEGGFRAMAGCLLEADLSPYDVNFVNAHATSTEIGDTSELNALKHLFGNKKYKDKEYFHREIDNFEFDVSSGQNINEDLDNDKLKSLVINSNKTQIGHLLGAAGSVESIFAILAMKNQTVLDNINTDNPVSDLFSFKYNNQSRTIFNYALKNSFAFGGVNTSVLYKRWSNI